jgi:hypothetical protein
MEVDSEQVIVWRWQDRDWIGDRNRLVMDDEPLGSVVHRAWHLRMAVRAVPHWRMWGATVSISNDSNERRQEPPGGNP